MEEDLRNLCLDVSHLSTVSCTFSCTMKYLVRDCDPNTGEPDDDGYDDEYVVRNHSTSANCRNEKNELCVFCNVIYILSLPPTLPSSSFDLSRVSCPRPSCSSSAGGSGGDGCRPHPEGFETKFWSSVGRSGR